MRAIDNFISNTKEFAGLPVSKTITAKLVPVGKTRDNIDKMNILESDKQREEAFVRVKKYIDRVHKYFIEECLKQQDSGKSVYVPENEFNKLYTLRVNLKNLNGKERKNAQKEIQVEENRLRKLISEIFKAHPNYKNLCGVNLFTELLPSYCNEEEMKDVNLFKGFYSYFTKFNKLREQLYVSDDIHTAVAHRIINDNYPVYIDNKLILERIRSECKELYDLSENGRQLFHELNQTYTMDYGMSSSYISMYNSTISGTFDEDGNQTCRGLNQLINEYRQKNKECRIPYFKPLYKNLMSDKKPLFSVSYFESTAEIKDAVITFNESIRKPYERFISYITKSFPIDTWCVEKKNLNRLSHIICSNPFTLDNLVSASKKFSKNQPDIYSASDFKELLSENILEETEFHFDFLQYKDYLLQFRPQDFFSKIPFDRITDIQYDKKQALELKEYLQSVLDYYNMLRILVIDSEDERIISNEITYNEEYYTELELIIDALNPIVKLYNKVRNFVTKSLKQEKEIKLNFDCSSLLDGWAESQEKVKNGLIFHDESEDKYYLGIYNQNMKKPDFEYVSDSTFKKMVLNTIPEPYKMLPKVFFSKKGLETYKPSEEIIEGYKNKLHKKSSGKFDLSFCHRLIDYYKDSIRQRDEWNCFNFNFKPTEEYQDTFEFFNEVSEGGYSLEMVGINKDILMKAVDEGSIFLFEIYNKYLANKAHGKDTYTQIIRSALSGKKSNVQFCGGAQIYYRPALIKEEATHKKGSVIVNKISKEGFTINSDVYKNICSHFNHNTALSSEAKTLLDSGSVIYKTADRDLYKDRRYMYESFSFLCPVKINWQAKDINPFTFNKAVLDAIRSDDDVKILSINRGENNLVYAVLMDKKGKVILDKSFNIIQSGKQNVNYKNKLIEKSKDRANSRTNWQEIDKIKDLKSGYLSFVIAEITRLIIENNAVLVLESLSNDFKSGRQFIESNIYQQFEMALVTKLSCIILKENEYGTPGSLEHPYQLVPKFTSFDNISLQFGFVFFINPAYISKTDPESGIINFFNFNALTNNEKRTEFFKNFDNITVENDKLVFLYHPGNFNKDFKSIDLFKVIAAGKRNVWNPKTKKFEIIDLELEGKTVYENLLSYDYTNIAELFKDKCCNGVLPHPAATERLLRIFMAAVSSRTFVLDDWQYISPMGNENEFTGKSFDFIAAYNLANKFKTILERSKDSEYLSNIKTVEYVSSLIWNRVANL